MTKINKEQFKVVVLHGGFEPESYGSNLTGENIYRALKNVGYLKVKKLFVDKNIISNLQKTKPDFAFLSMFCKWGEDGVIQSLLEVMNIPYSGCGVEASALSKNKYLFNRFVVGCGLNAPDSYFAGYKSEFENNKSKIKYPCIVKAFYQGYSLGTSLVKSPKKLKQAMDLAYLYSTKVTIQEYIPGREFTVSVIDRPNDKFVLPIAEVEILGHEIQDLEVKDNPNFLIETVPAKITKKQELLIKTDCLKLYKELGCFGVTRFDIRLGKDGKCYFLENNTCPGILNFAMSDLPKQLKAEGMSLGKYADNMVKMGLRRPEEKLEYKYDN